MAPTTISTLLYLCPDTGLAVYINVLTYSSGHTSNPWWILVNNAEFEASQAAALIQPSTSYTRKGYKLYARTNQGIGDARTWMRKIAKSRVKSNNTRLKRLLDEVAKVNRQQREIWEKVLE